MNQYDIDTIYDKYQTLNKKLRLQLIKSLRTQGYDVAQIETYTYSEAPGIRHLFVYFSGSREGVPYFLLDKKLWQVMRNEIMKL